MSTFVLIHGGWAAGWVWERVIPPMRSAGHRVHAPDLPGHGSDRTPPARVTLRGYVDRVLEAADAAGEPVVLVGHSSGGIAVTQAAEEAPEAIALLVYVAAYLPADGQSLVDVAAADREGLIMPNLVVSPDGASATVREEALREALFADCPPEDHRQVAARLTPEPLAPVATPLRLTAGRFGRVRRAYVECRDDRALAPALQRRMLTAAGCDPVRGMPTGHMPQYAAPRRLAAELTDLAEAAAQAPQAASSRSHSSAATRSTARVR